jgi:hypothetical protein
MTENYEPRQSRSTTHFKFFAEKYLWGSTKSELDPAERSVWLDFLCLATMNFGEIEVFSRDQLANQLIIPKDLLDSSIKKFIKHEKVKRTYNKKEKKETFTIISWDQYQADYLRKRQKKSTTYKENSGDEKEEEYDTNSPPTLHNTTLHKTKLNNTTSNNIKSHNTIEIDSEKPSHLKGKESQSMSVESDISCFKNKNRDKFLSRLKECPGYPFDEYEESAYFLYLLDEYPDVDILHVLDKFIAKVTRNPSLLDGEKIPRSLLSDMIENESNT